MEQMEQSTVGEASRKETRILQSKTEQKSISGECIVLKTTNSCPEDTHSK